MDYLISPQALCGVMVGDGSELTILKSTINKSTFEARDDLAPTGDFAICVVSPVFRLSVRWIV